MSTSTSSRRLRNAANSSPAHEKWKIQKLKKGSPGREQHLSQEGEPDQPEERPERAPEPGGGHAAEHVGDDAGRREDGQAGERVPHEQRDRQRRDGDELGARVQPVDDRVAWVVLGDRRLHRSASAASAAVRGAADGSRPSRRQSSTRNGSRSRLAASSSRPDSPTSHGPAAATRPAVEHQQLVAERPGEVDVVGGQHQRDAVRPEAREDLRQLAPRRRVEAHERLVQQEQARPHGEHAGERKTPLLAAGERIGVPPPEAVRRQPHELQRLVDGRRDVAPPATPGGAGRRPRPPAPTPRTAAAPASGRPGRPAAAAPRSRPRRPASPSRSTSPASGGVQALDHLQQGRLAGAGRAQQRQRLAGAHLEGHVAQRRDRRASLLVAEVDAPAVERHPLSVAHVVSPRAARSSSSVRGSGDEGATGGGELQGELAGGGQAQAEPPQRTLVGEQPAHAPRVHDRARSSATTRSAPTTSSISCVT